MNFNPGDLVVFGPIDGIVNYVGVVKNKIKDNYILHVSRQTLISVSEDLVLENTENLKPTITEHEMNMALKLINHHSEWNHYVLKEAISRTDIYDLQIINKLHNLTKLKNEKINTKINELKEMITNKGKGI